MTTFFQDFRSNGIFCHHSSSKCVRQEKPTTLTSPHFKGKWTENGSVWSLGDWLVSFSS